MDRGRLSARQPGGPPRRAGPWRRENGGAGQGPSAGAAMANGGRTGLAKAVLAAPGLTRTGLAKAVLAAPGLTRTGLAPTILAATIAAIIAVAAAAPAQAVDFNSKPFSQAEKFMEERLKLESADGSSWIPFLSSDREKIADNLASYWNGAIKALAGDEITALKDKIAGLQAKNRRLELKIAELELDKSSAPSSTKFYEVWKSSAGDITDKIADLRREIEGNRSLVRSAMGEIKAGLARQGIELTDDQIRNMFITVSGEDQLDAIVVLKNLYALSDTVKGLISSTTNLSINRKYYAIFYLAVEAHYFQLRQNIERIDTVYLPKLEALREENSALMAETRALARTNRQYQGNLAAQQITESVAIKYRDLLIRQKDLIDRRLEAIDDILLYTINTYRTVNLASGLSDSMDASVGDLAELLSMPIAPPMAFESNLEDKFLEISAILAAE